MLAPLALLPGLLLPAGQLVVERGARLVVIAPHPDDETLGAGGLIQHVLARGGTARVVLLTAGDGYVEAVTHATGEPRPRPRAYVAYGERRLGEARAAVRELDAGRVRLQLLGFPDGGLAGLLDAHWRRRHPEVSRTTDAARPPYREAVDQRLAYDGEDLRRELVAILRESQPTVVAFPDPLDRHRDHHAGGVFTLLALHDWLREPVPIPRLLAYLVHWPDWPPGWDIAGEHVEQRDGELVLPADLRPERTENRALLLTADEIDRKRAALARYVTQQAEMPAFLAAFVRTTEPFTVFSRTDVDGVEPP
jgi:LmbE family N-acetylglucosaminyl deacetylase